MVTTEVRVGRKSLKLFKFVFESKKIVQTTTIIYLDFLLFFPFVLSLTHSVESVNLKLNLKTFIFHYRWNRWQFFFFFLFFLLLLLQDVVDGVGLAAGVA